MDPDDHRSARLLLAAVLAGLFAALLLYRVLHAGHLEQTVLFYVGIPAVIALTVALTARPKSATGLIMSVITIGLALAGPLLNEGIVCLLMAAPIFYFIGFLIGGVLDWVARGRRREHALVAIPLLLGLALQGGSSAPPLEEVSATRVAAPGADIGVALTRTPVFRPFDSLFLEAGFPRPLASDGEGLQIGDTRKITFTPRRPLGIGAPPEPRSMTLRVSALASGRVVFAVVEDTTLARWLDLREAEFRWQGERLEVTLRYRRTFGPGWYFGPLQRYALSEAAGYLAATFTS
ncbi:hypothetical protein Psi02_48970 [Planotetraspora silvatica]|uniref:Uncharacterized protein n=1 Tax=Planotetraspora silvatica TaxID=234614 RepID=A0A8J3UNJ9_9ACTN|nr:hypothetical protein [Planotetraspora silvatica]GII48473.1 hypothetical protein Psi02_48970 [Planotetraspora silvatica]